MKDRLAPSRSHRRGQVRPGQCSCTSPDWPLAGSARGHLSHGMLCSPTPAWIQVVGSPRMIPYRSAAMPQPPCAVLGPLWTYHVAWPPGSGCCHSAVVSGVIWHRRARLLSWPGSVQLQPVDTPRVLSTSLVMGAWAASWGPRGVSVVGTHCLPTGLASAARVSHIGVSGDLWESALAGCQPGALLCVPSTPGTGRGSHLAGNFRARHSGPSSGNRRVPAGETLVAPTGHGRGCHPGKGCPSGLLALGPWSMQDQ